MTSFTKKYPELAERSPVYAELRNLIDLAVAAAYIQQQDYYGKAGWDLGILGNEKTFAVETYHAAEAGGHRPWPPIWKGNRLMTPIGGGVQIEADPGPALEQPAGRREGQGRPASQAKSSSTGQRPVVVGLTNQGSADQ